MLQEERKYLIGQLEIVDKMVISTNEYAIKLSKQNKKLKECVEFYADTDNWRDSWVEGDRGKKARECLEKVDEKRRV